MIDEMGLPSYLDGNFLSRKMAWGKLRVVISAGDFSLQDIVLDYGCGAGILFSTIANNVKEILATDLHLEIAKHVAEQVGVENVHFLSLNEFHKLPDDKFTKIIAANVLEHVDDLSGLIHRFRDCLKQDGTLIVSGPTENMAYRLGRRIVGFSGDYHVRDVSDIFSEIDATGRFKMKCSHSYPSMGPFCLYKIATFTAC